MKGKTVRAAFEDNNISQVDVSKIINCHSSTISYQLAKENIADDIAKKYLAAINTILEQRASAKELAKETEAELIEARAERFPPLETRIVKAAPDLSTIDRLCPFLRAECSPRCMLMDNGNCSVYWIGTHLNILNSKL